MIYKNRGDGWDLDEIYPLAEVVEYAEEISNLSHELENCKRTMTLQEMRDRLVCAAECIIGALREIGDDDELAEVDFGDSEMNGTDY